jgi:hypothetical protein
MQSKRNRLTRRQEDLVRTYSVGLGFLMAPLLILAPFGLVTLGLILLLVTLVILIRLNVTSIQSDGNRTNGIGKESMENSSRYLQNSPIIPWNHLGKWDNH